MFEGDALIIGFWLVPVTFFIVIPLIVLMLWCLARLLGPLFKVQVSESPGDEIIDAATLSTQDSK